MQESKSSLLFKNSRVFSFGKGRLKKLKFFLDVSYADFIYLVG